MASILKSAIQKQLIQNRDGITTVIGADMGKQVAALPMTVSDLIDLGSPDIEFCSIDHVAESSDLSLNPELLAMLKEKQQGGTLAFLRDSTAAV